MTSRQAKSEAKLSLVGWAAAALAAIALLGGGYVWANWQQLFVIPQKREVLLHALRDASSAQFRQEQLRRSGYVCGEINAKNGLGGYTGFQRYAAHEGDFMVEDTSVVAYSKAASSTAELVEFHDRKVKFMEAHGRIPTDEEMHRKRFADRWVHLCS